jgi:hypothetical protein
MSTPCPVRVADRFAATFPFIPDTSKVFTHGVFRVILSSYNPEAEDYMLPFLDQVEKDYQAAGFPLRGPVQVLIQGQKGVNRSRYFPSHNLVQLLPRHIAKESDGYFTVVHEIAHWFHYNRVKGGEGNRDVRLKYHEALKSLKGVDLSQTGNERERDRAKLVALKFLLEKKRDEASTGLKRGVIVSVPGPTGFQGPWDYIRQFKVLKAPGKKYTTVELLNPSPWDISESAQRGKKAPYIQEEATNTLLYNLHTQSQKDSLSALEKEYDDMAMSIHRKWKDDTSRRGPEAYENHLADWMPTGYARTNHLEWFAEMMSTLILKPQTLKPEVQEWLHTVA